MKNIEKYVTNIHRSLPTIKNKPCVQFSLTRKSKTVTEVAKDLAIISGQNHTSYKEIAVCTWNQADCILCEDLQRS